MNKTEIMSALDAVRQAGQGFTQAFNRLADVVESMASDHESLLGIIRDHESTINHKNDRIAELNKDNAEVYGRAQKAETSAWNLTQEQGRLKNDNAKQSEVIADYTKALYDRNEELTELRPFRDAKTSLERDLSERDATIAELRAEIGKLHEVILNVATSVDVVVNPRKPTTYGEFPKEDRPQAPAYDPGVAGSPHEYAYGNPQPAAAE